MLQPVFTGQISFPLVNKPHHKISEVCVHMNSDLPERRPAWDCVQGTSQDPTMRRHSAASRQTPAVFHWHHRLSHPLQLIPGRPTTILITVTLITLLTCHHHYQHHLHFNGHFHVTFVKRIFSQLLVTDNYTQINTELFRPNNATSRTHTRNASRRMYVNICNKFVTKVPTKLFFAPILWNS